MIEAAGDVPAIVVKSKPAGIRGDALAGWAKLSATNAMAGYMDWSTPTFYDTVTAAIQELMGGKLTPASFAKKLDADYLKYHNSSGPPNVADVAAPGASFEATGGQIRGDVRPR